MPATEHLKALIDQMPNPDKAGMFSVGIDKDKIEAAIAEIHKGGKENVLGIIEMLGEPGSDRDVKPHYALHGLMNHVLVVKDEKARKEYCDVLAGQLTSDRSKYIRGYLCQELQWAGRQEVCPALGKLLLDEELADPAAMALVAIREGAAEVLRAALPQAKGRCRLAIVHGLAALGDAPSAAVFKDALADADREVRIAAGRGLAKLGDAGALDALLKAADGEPGWERIQQTKHCLVLAEKLLAAGKKDEALKIYRHLRDTRTDPAEKYLCDAAEKAIAAAKAG
jgi:HEAT repeat protein